MKQLKYFLMGVLSIIVVLPIINKLLEVVDLWIETFKIKPSKKILNYEKDMIVLKEFIAPSNEYYVEEVFNDIDED